MKCSCILKKTYFVVSTHALVYQRFTELSMFPTSFLQEASVSSSRYQMLKSITMRLTLIVVPVSLGFHNFLLRKMHTYSSNPKPSSVYTRICEIFNLSAISVCDIN